ncbi:hypothetical protein SMICM304S_05426 [Streptomyces microflavus]
MAALVGDRVRHHQDPHRTGLARDGGQAPDPAQGRGRLTGDHLVVPRGDGPFLHAQDVGGPHLGVLHALAVDAPGRASRLSTPATYGTELRSTEIAPRATFPAAAARAVARYAELGALLRDGTVRAHRAVLLPHLGRERELTGDGVDPDVPVTGRGSPEVLDRRPDLPPLGGRHLDHRRLPVHQQRHPAHREPLPGDALETERHVEDGLRVLDGGRATDREDLGLTDRRRLE